MPWNLIYKVMWRQKKAREAGGKHEGERSTGEGKRCVFK